MQPMKIERINDKQIRCLLSEEDLSQRHIKLSELAYGNDRTRQLFEEIISVATKEFDFCTEELPLMIEAVPLSSNNLLMLVSKVDNPEELDVQFSQFSPDPNGEEGHSLADILPSILKSASEAIEAWGDLTEGRISEKDLPLEAAQHIDISKLYVFCALDHVIATSHLLADSYHARNTLFKAPVPGHYYLVVTKGSHTPEEFNKVCNLLSEYAQQVDFSVGQYQYLSEHMTVIEAEDAIGKLAQL